MSIRTVVQGHLNELVGANEDLSESRLAICRQCPIHIQMPFGLVCDRNKYINAEDQETFTYNRKEGYVRGCGCRLDAKSRVPAEHCIVNKW